MKLHIIALLSVFATSALSQELVTIQSSFESYKKEEVSKALSCEEIPDEIKRIESDLFRLSSQNFRFLDQISALMQDWYRNLSQYEGRPVSFNYGYFRPMYDSAQVVDRDNRMFRYEFRGLISRLRDLEVMSSECSE